MSMLEVVAFKWRSPDGYRSTFGPETVNTLARMVARHYHSDHRFSIITDDPAGIDPHIRVIPLWSDFADVPPPQGRKNPSCYRRLKIYSPEAATIIGPRFVALDLDCVITGDLRPLWDRSEPFVIWGGTHPRTHYNGSMVLMTAGARRQVWDRFDPASSPVMARTHGFYGSDQGWISYVLGRGEKMWTTEDGVYSYRLRPDIREGNLPANARMVIFHGKEDPWGSRAQKIPWVLDHWR